MLIQLTDSHGQTFYLNIDLIETVSRSIRVGTEIKLTTGGYVVCEESPESVAKKVNEANRGGVL